MTANEVTLLRKSGRLDEALGLANDLLSQDSSDARNQMSLFWVLRDYCTKIYLPEGRTDELNAALQRMRDLLPTMMDKDGVGARAYQTIVSQCDPHYYEITETSELSKSDPVSAYERLTPILQQYGQMDTPISEQVGWIMYRYLKHEMDTLPMDEFRRILREYLQVGNHRPSILHSSILKLVVAYTKNHPDFHFYRFLMVWGLTNLDETDFKPSVYNEKTMPSLLSRICRTLIETHQEFDYDTFVASIHTDSTDSLLDLFCEPAFWQLYHLHQDKKYDQMFEAFERYARLFSHGGPSLWHSEILKLAERYMEGSESYRFIPFFQQWDYGNLRPEDWAERTDDKGNTFKPLALKAAKKCFDEVKNMYAKPEPLLEWLASLYDEVLRKAPHDEWSVRHRAMIYVWTHDSHKALSVYRELVLQMSSKYYVWSEMAACTSDAETKAALYCKAISLESRENFLGQIRLRLADALIPLGMKAEALVEMNMYRHYREREGKKLSPLYMHLTQLIGRANGNLGSNKDLYDRLIPIAENFAFAQIESRPCVMVDRLTKDGKTRCFFVDDQSVAFQISEHRFSGISTAPLGAVFMVKYNVHASDEGDSYIQPLIMHPHDAQPWSLFPLQYGTVEQINSTKNYIFIRTSDARRIIHFYKRGAQFRYGDSLSFREYKVRRNGEWMYKAVDVHLLPRA